MDRVVIVGASLGGISAAKAVRAQGFTGVITVIGEEPHVPYDRPPLSKEVLTGQSTPESISLPGLDELDLDLKLGTKATGLDLTNQVVHTDNGDVPYDGLVLATGVRSRPLPTFPIDNKHFFMLRTLDDSIALRKAMLDASHMLIVGSGFVGIEVASSARALGCDVTLVSITPPLITAGVEVSRACDRLLDELDVSTRIGRYVSEVSVGADGQIGARLDDDEILECDLVVVAVGSIPNVDWLADSGLDISDGVLCDENCMAIGADNIVVVGDIARWPNPAYGGKIMRVEHWANAIEQGTVGGRNLVSPPEDRTPFSSIPSFWSDHGGPRLQAVGYLPGVDRFEVREGDVGEDRFVLAAFDGAQLVGGVGYGSPKGMAKLRVSMLNPKAMEGDRS